MNFSQNIIIIQFNLCDRTLAFLFNLILYTVFTKHKSATFQDNWLDHFFLLTYWTFFFLILLLQNSYSFHLIRIWYNHILLILILNSNISLRLRVSSSILQVPFKSFYSQKQNEYIILLKQRPIRMLITLFLS